MPIFQDDLGTTRSRPPGEPPVSLLLVESPPHGNVLTRKLSEESIRTDLCEGPVPETPEELREGSMENPTKFPGHSTSDRGELMERLKRGESPTWLPNRNLENLLKDSPQTPTKVVLPTISKTSPLLPSPELSTYARTTMNEFETLQAGLQIERPRSALHSGDFTETTSQAEKRGSSRFGGNALYDSEKSSWLSTSPPRDYSPFQALDRGDLPFPRSRAPSLSSSLSSSFVLKPPTSPLVQSQNNEDIDFSSYTNPMDIRSDLQRNIRRHTLQASPLNPSGLSLPGSSVCKMVPQLRRDSTFPYQAHQPRRSLTSSSMTQSTSTPQTPQTPEFPRSRRPSYSDGSPLHASMVGSYEESILRGRMSTTPSKPLNFLAQIGVLGLGKCKASLRCPSHVTVQFPAVFYSYETTTHGRGGKGEDGPSPYVGQIDLEGNLENQEEARDSKRRRQTDTVTKARSEDANMIDGPNPVQSSDQGIRRAAKQKRRSTSPRAPPGGSYRIPEKGQLQIVIKNPNKTAVKLFLVPYDLAGMEPGTKTFIRQRSYSAGSVIPALSSSQTTSSITPLNRPTLRYLVHLHICCSSRGHFYLYKSIRVVFANRVPDGKEKLRHEYSLPEPRFSVYKPSRDSSYGLSSGGGASLAAEKAYRRRSSGFALGSSSRGYDAMDGITQALEKGFVDSPGYTSNERGTDTVPIQPIPFSFSKRPIRTGDDAGQERPSNIQSPASSKGSRPPTSSGMSISSFNSNSTTFGGYDKLNKGDAGYGGIFHTSSPDGKQGVAEGLLAQKLRNLGMNVQNRQDHMDGI